MLDRHGLVVQYWVDPAEEETDEHAHTGYRYIATDQVRLGGDAGLGGARRSSASLSNSELGARSELPLCA